MKATSIFGGVQVFNIIILVIRSKFIAVFLGPAGMGISGLLTDSINLIHGLTGFGLSTSAVKNVAEANASGDEQRIGEVVTIFRRLVWLTGMLGFIVTLILAPLLSRWAFGNDQFSVAFALLSVTLLFSQVSIGQGVILQGMRKISYLAQSGMIGSVLGLFTSLPLYYFFAERGIVPAMIITSVTTLLLTWFFAKKVEFKKIFVSKEQTIKEGKGMLSLGIMLSLSGFITLGTSYLVRIFISKTGGLTDVGLYNAGFGIINVYTGLIFTAMATDYFPRLAGVAHDNRLASLEINQQAEIALLIVSPILCVFLIYINWAVLLLYSQKFIAVNAMIHWAALGMFFKAASWAVAFLLLAKGASKAFFWNELLANIYLLLLNLLGYHYFGLTGLGISFLVGYFLYLLQVLFVTKRMYGFNFSFQFLRIFLLQLVLGVSCFLTMKLTTGLTSYLIGSVLIIISTVYSFSQLNKRLRLVDACKTFVKRYKKEH